MAGRDNLVEGTNERIRSDQENAKARESKRWKGHSVLRKQMHRLRIRREERNNSQLIWFRRFWWFMLIMFTLPSRVPSRPIFRPPNRFTNCSFVLQGTWHWMMVTTSDNWLLLLRQTITHRLDVCSMKRLAINYQSDSAGGGGGITLAPQRT